MTPQENLRRALLNDEFPEDTAQDRLFTPSGADALRTNRNIALSAWMTQVSGQDINAGSATWQHDKDALAQGFFKMPNARNVTDEQLHGMVRSHIQTAEEAATLAADGALTGEPLPSVVAAVRGKRGASQLRPIFDRYEQDAMRRHTALAVKLAPYRPLVNQVAGDLKKTMEGPDALTPAFESAAEKLLSVPAEDRRLVLQAIGATGGKDAKERASTLQKMAVAMDRMAETMLGSTESIASRIGGTVQELSEAPAAIAGLLSGGTSLQGEIATGKARSEASTAMRNKIDSLVLLTQQIRTVADQEIDPIKGDGWWSQTGIDVARMVPQSAVTIANPTLVMAANWAYFENTIAGEAMLQDPRLTPQQARSIAGVSAPLNAAVETVTALIPFGRIKLPFIQKWLQATATSLPTTAARFGVRAAVGTAAEIGEEYIQAWTPLKAQELLGALSQDMPDVDWENRMPKFADIAAQTWGPALVFSLVGAGSVSISEVNSGRALASDVDLMVAQGLAPARAQSIAKAAEANNWRQVDALFRDDFVKPEKATDAEKAEATQRFLAKIQAHQEVETINAKEAKKIGGVRIFRDDEGWNVELADGSIIKADSADSARRYRDELYLADTEYEAETVIALADDLVKAFPGTRIELREEVMQAGDEGLTTVSTLTGKKTVIKDAKSLENLWNQATATGIQSGERVPQTILGDNFMELGQSIARVFRGKRGANSVPQAMTAMHEVIEAAWRKGVMAGQWSVESTRQMIATLVPTLEAGIAKLGKKAQAQELLWLENAKKAIAEGNEDLVREVFVEMAVRTWIGRDRDGNKTGLRPGTILRALDAAILQEAKPENVTTYQRLRAWFKAVGAYLKGVVATAKIIRDAERNGTIDDFTGFLDKVLGLEAATREESEVKADVQNMAFSLAPEMRLMANDQTPSLVTTKTENDFNDPNTFYRVVHGDAAFNDIVQTGLVRTNAASKGGATLAEKLAARPTAFPSFNKGFAAMSYAAKNPNNYIITTTDSSLQPSTSGRHSKGKTMFPTDSEGNHLQSLDGSKVDVWKHAGDGKYELVYSKGNVIDMAFSLAPDLRSSSQGYLGAVSEDGEVKIKSADLATDTHESSNLDPRNDGVGTFRYRKDNETLYWHFAPSEIRKESAIAALERKGFKVAKSKVISFGSEDSLIAHGLDRALVKGSTFSLAPTARPEEYSVQAFHGTDSRKFDQFDILKLGKGSGNEGLFSAGFYFSPSSDDASGYGKHLVSVGLKIKNPLIVPDSFPVMMRGDDSAEYWAGFETQMREALRSIFESNGFNDVARIDSVKMDESFIGSFARAYKALTGMDLPPPQTAEVSANLIKRAGFDAVYAKDGDTTTEIVIYDPANILIKNWNGKSINSTFSLSPQSGIDIVSDTLESWQDVFDKAAKRNPTRAMAIRDLAQQRINRLGEMWAADRWTAKGDKIRAVVEKRTKGSLDDEQAMREALRYQELLDAGMMTLTPQTLMAWSDGVDKLQNDPLVRAMLANGRLMSKATAERAGKLKTDGKGNAGDYDSAPWIPPQWYSKDAGHMPDTMAQTLYDEGILGDPSVDTLWTELEKAIKTNRAAKESYAKAEEAVKSIEKEARSQAKAEAAAWRQEADDMQADDWSPRESLVRDMRVLNVALSAFPPEVRAKVTGGSMVKLAGLATERARYKAIQTALEKAIVETERFMRKEYTEQIDKALDSYRSQKDSSGRISGKLPSQYTELVDYAYRIREADVAEQATLSNGLEKDLEESESDEDTQRILTKMGILRLFETWDTKDSTAMAAASEWLSDTIENGKLGRKLLDEERKAMLDDFRATAKKDAVPEGKISKVDVDNDTNQIRFKVFRRAWQGLNGMLDSAIHTLGQRLELVFGENSKITDHFITSFIRAANESNDIKRGVNAKYHDMLSVVFNSRSRLAHARGIGQMQKVKNSGVMITEGRKVKEVKLDIETLTKLADGDMTAEAAGLRQDQVDAALEEWATSERKRTVTVEVVENAGEQKERQMTELQGVQWWLWSRQDASRKQMERDGWTEESFKQLDDFLSPEAKSLGEWIASSYDDAARLIDPVYRRLFNAPLPRVKNYAPIYRNRSGDASVMDLDASDISSGLAAGFTKSRVNTVSPLAEMDAVTVMLSHWENVAHWVTHAEAVRDAKAVLLDRDVMTAIKQSSGNVSANSIKQKIAAIETQGTTAARELHDLNRFWKWLMQYRAYKSLAFRISPIVKQTPALLNPLLADVPAHSYTVGLARAFYDPAAFGRDVAAMLKSDTIMRRIEGGFSAEARIAMQGEGAMGSVALAWMQRGMMPMAWTDAGWTALGAAVSFDYYKRGYMAENPQASAAMADAYATRKLEKMIATSAQPSDIVNRSLIEASSNPFMRSLWMFASDQRKALGIEVTALKKLLSGKSKNKAMDIQRIIVAHFAQAAMSQLMASILASFLGDDEDKEREWSREQWTLSLAIGPINGLFVFGRAIDMVGRRILNMPVVQQAIGTGQKLPIFTNKTIFEQGVNDVWNAAIAVDDLFDPENADDLIGAMESLAVGASAALSAGIGPQAGVVDVTANLLREGNKIIKAATEED